MFITPVRGIAWPGRLSRNNVAVTYMQGGPRRDRVSNLIAGPFGPSIVIPPSESVIRMLADFRMAETDRECLLNL